MLKVLRIALYAVGGFFIYIVNLLSFISLAQLTTTHKLGIAGHLCLGRRSLLSSPPQA
jgi:hypothetical protein